MAVLMVCVRIGDRSLPLAWIAEEGSANIGFEGQRIILEQVLDRLPRGVQVMLLAERLERLILIMSLAMYGCVRVGRDDALHRPTPLEKKLTPRPTPTIGAFENSTVARYRGSNGGYVA